MRKLLAATMSVVTVFSLSATVGMAQTSCPPEVASAKAMLTQTAKSQDVQAPRSLAGARSQDVQAPRSQDVQAPRSLAGARSQDVQAPRSQEIQAPRGQDVQAPRGQNIQWFNEITNSEETKKFLARAALDAFPGSPEQMAQLIKSETERWGRYVKMAKIQPQ